MGYDFIGQDTTFEFDDWQMEHVRLVMLEAGVIAGARLFGREEFGPSPDTLPAGHFAFHERGRITPEQSAFIAARLRAALAADLIGDMALFYAEQPTQLPDWVERFATFNEAATAGGYQIH